MRKKSLKGQIDEKFFMGEWGTFVKFLTIFFVKKTTSP